MLIADVLKRQNNNLNVVRLWLAFAVIVEHLFVFIKQPVQKFPIETLWPFTSGGHIAVVVFFFLSGLFVTNSLVETQNIKRYCIDRFLRIYPAFFICLVVSALVCFFFSSLDLSAYVKSASTYVFHNLFIGYQAGIDSVSFMREDFPMDGQYAFAINGSLWVILHQVKLYILLAILYCLATRIKGKEKEVLSITFFIGLLSPFLFPNQILVENSIKALSLVSCFSFGGLLALYKDKIIVDWRMPVAFFLLGYMLSGYISQLCFFCAFCTLCLFVSTLKIIRAIPLKIDISYSVYLYGWFVQQLVQYFLFPYINYFSYGLICIALSSVVGLISYYCVEYPSAKLAQKLSRHLSL